MSLLRRVVVVSRKTKIQKQAQQVAKEIYIADDLSEALDISDTINPDFILFDQQTDSKLINDFICKADEISCKAPVIVLLDKAQKEQTPFYKQTGAIVIEEKLPDPQLLQLIISGSDNKANTSTTQSELFIDNFAQSICLVGLSKGIEKTLKMIKLVASSRCNPVLIVGETGSGKEVAARAIHSIRHPNEKFVAINCAALTANLLESELFGHEKGAFTGADRDKIGLIEMAGTWTVFLDEISEMPLDLQAKLLRVLQEKTFRKVGGISDIKCNATIIATSNRNLKKEVEAKRFRSDLYYRLNIFPINMPPLRSTDRKTDIELLAMHFMQTSQIISEEDDKATAFTRIALDALNKHHWPGNVRELKNVIERALILETTDRIGLDSIVIEPAYEYDEAETSSFGKIRDFSLEKAEKELISRALHKTGWQKTQAATLLGITRATLYAKVKQYGIEQIHSPYQNSNSPLNEPVAVG